MLPGLLVVTSNVFVGRIAAAQRQRQWSEIEPLLVELGPSFGPNLVAPLLSTLVDDVTAEAEVFAIVHLAEATADRPYVLGLLEALPVLVKRAPRWARILLSRVVNSPGAFEQLMELARDQPDGQRRALLDAADALERWRPAIGAQVALIRDSLREKTS